MSKKSRKKSDEHPQDMPEAESAETAGGIPGGEEVAQEHGESTVVEEGLPHAVPGEALAGEVPAGDIPSLPLILEAILFASQKPVTPKELTAHLKNAAAAEPTSPAASHARIREADVASALVDLQAEVAAAGRAYQVRETATGWILSSGPGFAPWLRALYPEAKPTRLSPSALETLAIIAYRQPITRADMEAVRGVSVDGVMQTLLDRGLVKIAGRAEIAGRPLLYATTQFFLDHFGLRNLDELPNATELRTIPLPRAVQPEETPGAGDASPSAEELPLESHPTGGTSGESEPENIGNPDLPVVEVTEILEVRESVVFEEIAAGALPVAEESAAERVSAEGIPEGDDEEGSEER